MLATLVGYLRDFEVAEDALQEAFLAAVNQWPREGLPDRPGAWLTTVARRRGLDALRRRIAAQTKSELWMADQASYSLPVEFDGEREFPDERLKLIFLCCHPALSLEDQIALTLRSLGGLSTTEVASALLLPEATLAQRLVRVKRKIKDAGLAFELPGEAQWGPRLDGVFTVIYLIFNEGYYSSSDGPLVKSHLCEDAIALARALVQLLVGLHVPGRVAEAKGLLALLLFSASRSRARTGGDDEVVLLDAQDRQLWDRDKIDEAQFILDQALALAAPGPYQIQAAISALHAVAPSTSETDWLQIVALYRSLLRLRDTPVVALNLAIAVLMARGPEFARPLLDALDQAGSLKNYFPFSLAKAELLVREGHNDKALAVLDSARALARNDREERLLRSKIDHLRTR